MKIEGRNLKETFLAKKVQNKSFNNNNNDNTIIGLYFCKRIKVLTVAPKLDETTIDRKVFKI